MLCLPVEEKTENKDSVFAYMNNGESLALTLLTDMHSCGTETRPVSAVSELISIAARLSILLQTCCQDIR